MFFLKDRCLFCYIPNGYFKKNRWAECQNEEKRRKKAAIYFIQHTCCVYA